MNSALGAGAHSDRRAERRVQSKRTEQLKGHSVKYRVQNTEGLRYEPHHIIAALLMYVAARGC